MTINKKLTRMAVAFGWTKVFEEEGRVFGKPPPGSLFQIGLNGKAWVKFHIDLKDIHAL
jgi:hypothetical protein